MSNKVVFFGNERLIQGLRHTDLPILNGLYDAGFEILAIVANNSEGKSRTTRPLEVGEFGKKHNIPVFLPEKPSEILSELKKLNADIGVLVAYGRIVPTEIIDIFPHSIVNVHPSRLPKYRGTTPIETAILNGDKSTSVSLMSLTAEMDAGPIYKQKSLTISDDETSLSLSEKCASIGTDLLIENLSKIISGELKPRKQPHVSRDVSYTKKLTTSDGLLDPSVMTATECERRVRAFIGFPRTQINLLGREIIIIKAKSIDNYAGDDWPDIIKCVNNTYLQIIELINPKSGKTMKTADYLRGLQ